MTKWHDDSDNVLALARWLNDRGELADVSATIYYFEKPWKEENAWLHREHHATLGKPGEAWAEATGCIACWAGEEPRPDACTCYRGSPSARPQREHQLNADLCEACRAAHAAYMSALSRAALDKKGAKA